MCHAIEYSTGAVLSKILKIIEHMFGSYLLELLIVKETKTKKTKNYSMKIERNVLSIVGSTNDGK